MKSIFCDLVSVTSSCHFCEFWNPDRSEGSRRILLGLLWVLSELFDTRAMGYGWILSRAGIQGTLELLKMGLQVRPFRTSPSWLACWLLMIRPYGHSTTVMDSRKMSCMGEGVARFCRARSIHLAWGRGFRGSPQAQDRIWLIATDPKTIANLSQNDPRTPQINTCSNILTKLSQTYRLQSYS